MVDPEFHDGKPAKIRTCGIRPTKAPITPPYPEKIEKELNTFFRHFNNFLLFADTAALNQYFPKAVEVAAYAHHQITRIHPFEDGNGRTARAVQNAILKHYGLPPAIIYPGEKKIYIGMIREADKGYHNLDRTGTEETVDLRFSKGEINLFNYIAKKVDEDLGRILNRDFKIQRRSGNDHRKK